MPSLGDSLYCGTCGQVYRTAAGHNCPGPRDSLVNAIARPSGLNAGAGARTPIGLPDRSTQLTTVPNQAPARPEADAAPALDFDGEAARIAAAQLLAEGNSAAEIRAYADTRSELGYMWRRIASAMEELSSVPAQAAAPDLEAVPG